MLPFPERLARLAAQQQAQLTRLSEVHLAAWEDALRGELVDRKLALDLVVQEDGEAEGNGERVDSQEKECVCFQDGDAKDTFDPVPANPWAPPAGPKVEASLPSNLWPAHTLGGSDCCKCPYASVKLPTDTTEKPMFVSDDLDSVASSILSQSGLPPVEMAMTAAKSISTNKSGQADRSSTRPGALADKVKPIDFHLSLSLANDKARMRLLLDYVAGGLVFLNCLLLMLELEVEGRAVGAKVGFEDPVDVSRWLPFFKFIDTTFIFIFLLESLGELLIRVWVEWPFWHRDLANHFDLCLVIAGMVDLFVIVPMAGNQSDAMMRVAPEFHNPEPGRTLKSLRSVRLLRTFRFVRGLRLLVQACQCFLPSLCWSMVLLAVFMSMGALVLGNLLLELRSVLSAGPVEFSQNESEELEDRQWIWLHYGTAYRALYTLYEITFAGNWPTNVRPVLDKVSHAYVIFFLLYITIVVFAVIRVITAIFLKDTLDAAQNDSDPWVENLVVERLRKKAEYVERLEAVFKAIDRTGDGMITEERLEEILSHPKVAAYFNTLDLDETSVFFHIIDNGDGEVTLDEFIDGILRCKGNARAVDSMAIRAELKRLHGKSFG
eukprot:s118_g14.t1